MKRTLIAAVAAAALIVPAGNATNAPPANGHGLFTHETTCYGAPIFPGWPGIAVTMDPLAAGSTFWITVSGVELHFRVQSATITYDSDPGNPVTYSYGKKTGLADTVITCYGSFPGYSVVSEDVLIR